MSAAPPPAAAGSTAQRAPTRAAGAPSPPAAHAGDSVVQVQDLHYSIGGREIFAGLSLQVRRGSITAVMGPSGTGKTTLLRLIMGQTRADSGALSVFGEDVARLSRERLYALRQRIGLLFQNGALLTDLSVFENVAFPVREHARLPESVLRKLVLMKLQAVGLRGAAELMPSELSGGMARRVALARAIVMDPEVLIYDEPFVGLDPISMGVICRLIQSLNETLGITSIVVSHDVHEISMIAHYSYLLSGGRVVAEGSPGELAAASGEVVRQFMSGSPDGPVPFHYPAGDYYQQLIERDR
ncbi:MAG TPA: ATP-binding cassette domain-containing protein [Steroidobacteraceae bacterium]|jgi:phospholipid/cholesterol/gamma-HCH transport system ATP-binding protein